LDLVLRLLTLEFLMKIVVAGGTGFIGKAFTALLPGEELVCLVRHPDSSSAGKPVFWDGKTISAWASELDGADAVVNLAGAPVTLRWSPANRKRIIDSRVEPTSALAAAIQQAKRRPRVWINGSASGFYGDCGDRVLTEENAGGAGFLADVCQRWEEAARTTVSEGTRLVLVRTGFVLGQDAGALPTLVKLAKLGLGGPAGSGRQWVPWIHVSDLCRMMIEALGNERFSGGVNACAPRPVTNRDLMAGIRHRLGRHWAPPAPALALRLLGKLAGPDAELLLNSQRMTPKAAIVAGFEWQFETLQAALQDLV
jgi:uncharacterized protein (TIGR01777 family)